MILVLKVALKAPKNDVLKTISNQIIFKTLSLPSSVVKKLETFLNVGYYQQNQIMIMKLRSSARVISRAYSYPNHLVFANDMLKHLYQIMIRSY